MQSGVIPAVAGGPRESHLEESDSPSKSFPEHPTPAEKARGSEDSSARDLESPVSDHGKGGQADSNNDPYSNLAGAFGGYVTDVPQPVSANRGGHDLDDLLA